MRYIAGTAWSLDLDGYSVPRYLGMIPKGNSLGL